ncbi:hypothetical protein LPB140_06815 [Sphingorhabdus lutea]|uniref:ATP synthase subunit b n=1 Tax=Sphingorhabdus lutea TaxID=1913578 RepID=A0A1L3JBN5_9SPHN|nr:hypothetical protein [Sphingorhabdus lutea]APG62541.1 hypothetical protein LPB140_06815 [Sphingorhabdus lutea]
MPQIAQIMDTYASQFFWLLLTFGLTFFVIGMGMFPKVQGTVMLRDAKIREDLDMAKRANETADRYEEEYRRQSIADREKAKSVVVEAKVQADADRAQKIAKIDAELDVKMATAEAEISQKVQAALNDIEVEAASLTGDIVAKLTNAKIGAAEITKYVKAAS